jgi:hypothetical protein
MQDSRSLAIGPGGQRNLRTKHDTSDAAAAIGILDHRSEQIISVTDNIHAGNGAQVQIAQHVAGGDRSHEQLFQVVAMRIAAECRVGRCLGTTRGGSALYSVQKDSGTGTSADECDRVTKYVRLALLDEHLSMSS